MHCGPRGQLEPEPAKPATLLRKGELISVGGGRFQPGGAGPKGGVLGQLRPGSLRDLSSCTLSGHTARLRVSPVWGCAPRYREFFSDKSRGIPSIYFNQSILCPGTPPCSYAYDPVPPSLAAGSHWCSPCMAEVQLLGSIKDTGFPRRLN